MQTAPRTTELASHVELKDYRKSELDRARIADLLDLSQCEGDSAIDVGTRDDHLACLLADRFASVTALDLEMPLVPDARVACAAGDVRRLRMPDNAFDLVICAEVLEHIPPADLSSACNELARITRRHLLIGVPYRQDTRLARTTCSACGECNPPWGHVNRFDEHRLRQLFTGLDVARETFVGRTDASTNFVASFLMNLAGNPYGTYGQDEPCTSCGAALREAPPRAAHQKALTRIAFWASAMTTPFARHRPNWIHVLFSKSGGAFGRTTGA